jgi:TrpR family trp operon transcriptional repressor
VEFVQDVLNKKQKTSILFGVEENTKSVERDVAMEEGLRGISQALAKTDDEALIRDFLDCLLTPAERRVIAQRWLLVREIKRGTSQRVTAKKLGVSLCKITRGSSELKKPDSAFRRMMDL